MLDKEGEELNEKLNLVKLKGGCCEICGYKKNLTALTFFTTLILTQNYLMLK